MYMYTLQIHTYYYKQISMYNLLIKYIQYIVHTTLGVNFLLKLGQYFVHICTYCTNILSVFVCKHTYLLSAHANTDKTLTPFEMLRVWGQGSSSCTEPRRTRQPILLLPQIPWIGKVQLSRCCLLLWGGKFRKSQSFISKWNNSGSLHIITTIRWKCGLEIHEV